MPSLRSKLMSPKNTLIKQCHSENMHTAHYTNKTFPQIKEI